MPVIAPVVDPNVMMPVPSGLLQKPPGELSLNVTPECKHIAVVPDIAAGRAFTNIFVVVAQPVGKV